MARATGAYAAASPTSKVRDEEPAGIWRRNWPATQPVPAEAPLTLPVLEIASVLAPASRTPAVKTSGPASVRFVSRFTPLALFNATEALEALLNEPSTLTTWGVEPASVTVAPEVGVRFSAAPPFTRMPPRIEPPPARFRFSVPRVTIR